MSTTLKQAVGSTTAVLTTGLNSLATTSLAISASYDNTQAAAGDGYVRCDLELVVTFGVAPTAGTGCSIWLLRAQDGTNYEDGGTSTTPSRPPDAVIIVRAVTTAQRITREAWMPPGKFKVLLKNDGTGQTFAASGNTLTLRPITEQGI